MSIHFKRNIGRLSLALAILTASAVFAEAASIVMPLVQVKQGMKGKGRSVFEGNKIEDFEAEILGVLENFQPKRSLILARLKGRGLENTGVISGMSGSPVYIDGKLIGSVSYSFSFAKEAIAGITPIEEMLSLEREQPVPKPGSSARLPFQQSMSLEDLAGAYQEVFSSKRAAVSKGQMFVPVSLPLVFSGFSPRAFDDAKPFFAELGFLPLRGGVGGQASEKPGSGGSLQEGDAVGIQLVGGDLDLSAVGTVTHVDGSKVIAFGHPFYNLGAVDYAMTRANVIAVVPSLESSFKMAATGSVIGRFSQDRTAGAFGEIGKMPQPIPVNIKLQGGPFSQKEYKIKVTNDRILSPALVNIAVSSIITSEERSYGNLSLDFDADIYMDKGINVHLEDLFSGNFDSAATSLSGIIAAVVYFLTNNEFKDVGIYRIDLNVRAVEEARFCSLEKVLLDKYEVSPGERLDIKVHYRTYKEESLVEEVSISAPNLPAGTEFHLVVGDALTMQQVEKSQYRTQDFVPRSLSQLIRLLNNLRKNNRIYFKVLAAKPGLFLKGEELPNLPPTLKSMFASPRASASSPQELSRSTLSEYQLPVPYVFKGMAVVPVKIRK